MRNSSRTTYWFKPVDCTGRAGGDFFYLFNAVIYWHFDFNNDFIESSFKNIALRTVIKRKMNLTLGFPS